MKLRALIRNYAKQNGIFLNENPSIDLLLAKAKNLIDEMDTTEINTKFKKVIESADEKKRSHRTDEDEPVPNCAILIYYKNKNHFGST